MQVNGHSTGSEREWEHALRPSVRRHGHCYSQLSIFMHPVHGSVLAQAPYLAFADLS